MYRVTKRQTERIEAMKRGRERARLGSLKPDYPFGLPELRRELIVIDHDFGTVTHHFKFYRTGRIDQFRVDVDEKPWQQKIGWSRVLAGLRKSMPRVMSERNLFIPS